jgi:hypothetical protein
MTAPTGNIGLHPALDPFPRRAYKNMAMKVRAEAMLRNIIIVLEVRM